LGRSGREGKRPRMGFRNSSSEGACEKLTAGARLTAKLLLDYTLLHGYKTTDAVPSGRAQNPENYATRRQPSIVQNTQNLSAQMFLLRIHSIEQ
jgi:hypothetical protein